MLQLATCLEFGNKVSKFLFTVQILEITVSYRKHLFTEMMETEIHWMGLQPYGDAYKIAENTTLSEEGNLLDLQVKTEYVDYSYDLKSEIKVEENPVPVSFPVVKSKFDHCG
ncbi:uncharacterized protein [Periplaneta americana]|uniref:uncharacterized protein n=1 Tax=Periplaneta americana TaxID=6978 RepID=UPI0037E85116